MPASGAGMAFVSFGISQMIAMVAATRPSMVMSGMPLIQTTSP